MAAHLDKCVNNTFQAWEYKYKSHSQTDSADDELNFEVILDLLHFKKEYSANRL